MLSHPEVFALTIPFGVVLLCLIVESSNLGASKVVGAFIKLLFGALAVFGFIVAFTGPSYFGALEGNFGVSALSASMLGMLVVKNIKVLRGNKI
jgi:hypothetical protein